MRSPALSLTGAGLTVVSLSSCSPLWLEPFSTEFTTSAGAEAGTAGSEPAGPGTSSTGGTDAPTTTAMGEGLTNWDGAGTSGAGTSGTGGTPGTGGTSGAAETSGAGETSGAAETGTQSTGPIDSGTTSCASETEGCEPNPPPVCNDGLREAGESCDGPDLGGESCTGLGWDGGELACSPTCAFDTSGCTGPPLCAYAVEPEAPGTTYAAPYKCPGGIAMPISGTIDPVTGMVTVSSPGKPGNYGPGTYRVYVYRLDIPASSQCKPFNVVKATKVLAAPATSLSFPAFDSLLTCGEDKGYCIAKEDAGDPAFFCSGMLKASYL